MAHLQCCTSKLGRGYKVVEDSAEATAQGYHPWALSDAGFSKLYMNLEALSLMTRGSAMEPDIHTSSQTPTNSLWTCG